ncbi:CYTH and CHAD domain-containing protein [Streptomyces sp. NBC_01264]|uniref:CYTH and CHAD domain-containing protein n=1 Tax=Streptomyces sp. NBC_01264 TaxID=2903804 RepID=UPI00224FE0F9|nr:CYTH and CHAD domain-containing protein [Streptomyces sp. NBC_01264]MCX4778377.1 CYTH and CHAD domain-containing protein [Streptomyces sp. NBC_01264]
MADTKREIERKFEFRTTKAGRRGVPDLTGTAAIAAVTDQGTAELDAVYYDTPDQRLATDGLTLRRRTGGKDAGWHLKLPVAPGVRDEITAPLGDTVPDALTALLRSRVRDAPLEPQVRLLSSRKVSHLLDADGALLAELSTDAVRAERADATAAWTEVEVELADGADPALLDAVEKTFRKAGLRVSDAPSKLARALTETGGEPPARTTAPEAGPAEDTVGAHVLAYLREQRDTLIAQDPAVRRALPDSVHQMRVATRRLRSAFKTYRRLLDPAETGPIGEELRWLAAELGVDRDQEVLLERIQSRLDELPRTLVLGPVRGRLKIWNVSRRTGSRRAALAALDSRRHVALLNSLDALLADPPLLKAAARPAGSALPAAVLADYERLAGRIGTALSMDPGEDRDLALHEARKAAKRARYAAEAAAPALGKPARKLAKAVKAVQSLLGDHQDGVVAREALRGLGVQAAGAGESSFTWGVLYAREEALAERRERELPQVWAATAGPAAALRG